MTLIVKTFRKDPKTGDVVDDPHPEAPGADLAGVEAWRTAVWGSHAARRRGATFLPQLADHDLYVGHEDLPAFRAECLSLLADVEALARELGHRDAEGIAFRLRNLLAAAERTDPESGGVYIG